MTDPALSPEKSGSAPRSIREAVEKRLAARHREERGFRRAGVIAIGFATLMLVVLLSVIGWQAASAFRKQFIHFETPIRADLVDPQGARDPAALAENVAGFHALVREDLVARFPEAASDPVTRAELNRLVTRLAVLPLARDVARDPAKIGQLVRFRAALNDDLDLYLKGRLTPEKRIALGALDVATTDRAGVSRIEGDMEPLLVLVKTELAALAKAQSRRLDELRLQRNALAARLGATPTPEQAGELAVLDADIALISGEVETLRARAAAVDAPEAFGPGLPSLILRADNQFVKLSQLAGDHGVGTVLTGPQTLRGLIREGGEAWLIAQPEESRTVSDQQIAWSRALQREGRVRMGFNTDLFSNADSTYPEIAGALAAIVGSLFTMAITAALALPIGVAAAIYLEEYAPKNRLTDILEVNINNLAAVPSIVFGLLGAAVFLNTFGMARGAPYVGGLVLALMTLPTVIIASRAALKSVPPSIRQAALGVGASRTQAVFHHVLPLALPGILTGAIIGLARALGETAPLLLIGMVAFVAEVPDSATDESTVLPVLIFKWSTGAERAWEPLTAAVIVILLAFMIAMNALAVVLRRRFERRW